MIVGRLKEMVEVVLNLKVIRDKILAACKKRTADCQYYVEPKLVAVSKLQPPELIIQAYDAGQRYFGENYVNELVNKGTNPDVLEKCKEIQWHFIGHLQRNKVNTLLKVPNLSVVETVDNDKLATALNSSWPKFRKIDGTLLKVMIQVNTSRETEKSGCQIEEVSTLAKHIIDNCPNLEFIGLMTIGKLGYDVTDGPNADFLQLKQCRDQVSKELDIDLNKIELSMGMSADFEHAVELGSTSVRVGSAIFGARPPKNT